MSTELRKKLVEIAQGYVGKLTGPVAIANYNKLTGATLPLSSAWCAATVTMCARQAGIPAAQLQNYAGCTTAMKQFKAKGMWRVPASYTPKAGDAIFFDNDSDDTDSEHTGIVTGISGNYVQTVEGNTGGACKAKKYLLTAGNILGYAEWDNVSGTTTVSEAAEMSTIKAIQTGINTRYKLGIAVDGAFGPVSKKALIKAVQTEINASCGGKLVVDGIYGSYTKTSCPSVKKGDTGNMVWLLQAALNIKDVPTDMDSSFGPVTLASVKKFQTANGLTVDGVAGGNTFAKLLA